MTTRRRWTCRAVLRPEWQVRTGQFDLYLVRPVSPLLQFMTQSIQVSVLGDFLGGLAIFAAASADRRGLVAGGYLPATVLLDRTAELHIAPAFAYLAPLVGVVWLVVAAWTFNRQISNDQSAGH